MKLVTLSLLATLALGCAVPTEGVEVESVTEASPRPYGTTPARIWTVIVDPSVDAERMGHIERAFAAWNEASPCPMLFDVVRAPVDASRPLPPASIIEVTMAIELPKDPRGLAATGWTNWDEGDGSKGSRIRFLTSGPMWDFDRAALHELGHAFRLPHDDAELSVMATTGRTARVTDADAAAYAARWCR